MILKALKYGSPDWSITSGKTHHDFVDFENINLIVGKNATGKTKFIDALRWISDILDDEKTNSSMSNKDYYFDLFFDNGKDRVRYNVDFKRTQFVVNENLYINEIQKLNRKTGKLFYEKLGQFLDFEIDTKFLVSSRRDNLQQPFFELLHTWGRNLAHYRFGENMGRWESEKLHDFEDSGINFFKNLNKVRTIYKNGIKKYDNFEAIIIADMQKVDYNFRSITLKKKHLSEYLGLYVQETDLESLTNFDDMSQGMARAFSLLVQLNYSLMAKIPSCILIDDIGEGLDYERSKSLIELIIKKVEGSNIQLFMTTNDRFVMNSVPLKYWSVIHREGNKSVFYNYQNSKHTFDDFAFTGLNNFDFFATEFYRQGFEEFISTAQ